jgi:hypothetical protein
VDYVSITDVPEPLALSLAVLPALILPGFTKRIAARLKSNKTRKESEMSGNGLRRYLPSAELFSILALGLFCAAPSLADDGDPSNGLLPFETWMDKVRVIVKP